MSDDALARRGSLRVRYWNQPRGGAGRIPFRLRHDRRVRHDQVDQGAVRSGGRSPRLGRQLLRVRLHPRRGLRRQARRRLRQKEGADRRRGAVRGLGRRRGLVAHVRRIQFLPHSRRIGDRRRFRRRADLYRRDGADASPRPIRILLSACDRHRHLRRLLLQLLPPQNRRQRLALDAHCRLPPRGAVPRVALPCSRNAALVGKKGRQRRGAGRACTH